MDNFNHDEEQEKRLKPENFEKPEDEEELGNNGEPFPNPPEPEDHVCRFIQCDDLSATCWCGRQQL